MTDLPYSPAARAFFAALDGGGGSNADDDAKQVKHKKPPQSALIQKKIQTLGWRNRYSQADQYPIDVKGNEFSVRQIQRGELEGTYGTGATVWPASIVLVKYLEQHSVALIQGKRVLDLGAGTAITSIAAAVLGASHVICTDGEASVVQLARDNIQSAAKQLITDTTTITKTLPPSGAKREGEAMKSSEQSSAATIRGCSMDVQKYWWGDGRIESDSDCCDVILVSDCVLPKLYPIAPLVDALHHELVHSRDEGNTGGDKQAVAILSYEHRYYPEYDPKDKFRELCEAKQLVVSVIPMEEQDPVYSVDDIEIWHVTRQRES